MIKVSAVWVSPQASLHGLQMAVFSLCSHVVFPLCTHILGVSLCIHMSSSLKTPTRLD